MYSQRLIVCRAFVSLPLVCAMGASLGTSPAKENPAPERIVTSAIENQGGIENLKKFGSFFARAKGVVHLDSEQSSIEMKVWFKAPNQTRLEIQASGSKVIRAFDKDKGWEKINDDKPMA